MAHFNRGPGWWAVAAGVMAAGTTCSAIQPPSFLAFSAGPVLLRPRVDLGGQYNDNLFYAGKNSTNHIGDFATLISPGLNVFVGRPEENFISLDYTLDASFYVDNPGLNEVNHAIALRDHWHGAHLEVKGQDKYEIISGILGLGYNQNNKPIHRTHQTDTYTVSYDISQKSSVYVSGMYDATDYESGVYLLDPTTWAGTAGIGLVVGPKTIVFSEVYYGQSKVGQNLPVTTPTPDVAFGGVFVGARGSFTPKLTGDAKIGYELRQYSDNASTPSGFVAEIELEQYFTDRTSLKLTYRRRNTVSVEVAGQSYVMDLFGLLARQRLGRGGKWVAEAGAVYQSNAYGSEPGIVFANRHDSLYSLSFGLTYEIQLWLKASLTYDFSKLESNDKSVEDYDVSRITAKLTVGY